MEPGEKPRIQAVTGELTDPATGMMVEHEDVFP